MIDIPDIFFPKGADGQSLCPKCKKTVAQCTCPSYDPSKPKTEHYKPSVRIETAGRGGKAVTVVRQLPADETYLKHLAKIIKTRIAGGGTYYIRDGGGVIEIQGRHQPEVERILENENFSL